MKNKIEVPLLFIVIGIIANIVFWLFFPSTYLKDGIYVTTRIGFLYPLHYIMPYYTLKLYLTRYGFFVNSAGKCVAAIGVITLIELILRVLGYIRSAHIVTIWWILGVGSLAVIMIAYTIDNLLYEVKFEITSENNEH